MLVCLFVLTVVEVCWLGWEVRGLLSVSNRASLLLMETPYDESWDGSSGWRAVTGEDGLSGNDVSDVWDGGSDGAGWSGD